MTTVNSLTEATQLIRWAQIAGQGLGVSSAEQLAASLMARAFISADVDGADAAMFTRERLTTMAREMVLQGQTLWRRVPGDILWTQQATIAKRTGNYRISGKSYRPSQIMHCRVNIDMQTGMGRADLDIAFSTREVLRQLENNLAYETKDASGYLVPTSYNDSQVVQNAVKDIDGARLLVPTENRSFLQAPGSSSGSAIQHEWTQRRLGFDAPETVRGWLESYRLAALGVLGVPGSLYAPTDAAAMREGWRVYIFTVVDPMARLLEQSAARAGLRVDLNFDRLMASDVANRARAYGSLVQANMDEDEAARHAGFAR